VQAPSNDNAFVADLLSDAIRRVRCDHAESASALVEQTVAVALSKESVPVAHLLRLYDLVFELHARNLVREARALTRRLAEWIASSPDPLCFHEALRFEREAAREMAALPLRFDTQVRRVIAEALLARSLELACEECWLISAESRLVAVESAQDLIALAPKLAAQLVPFLDPHADLDDLRDA
jgi:hypothetical protein